MAENQIVSSRYIYIHETGKWSSQTVDIHHVIAKKNHQVTIFACFLALVLLSNAFYLLEAQDKLISVCLFYLMIGVIFVKLLRHKIVGKESIVIIPAFGVQLETHYRSGRAVRHFVPIDKILKPILNECVTSVTCYWSLALLLREEDKLMLVFKELQPPFKMLLPIWKALCAAKDSSESLNVNQDTWLNLLRGNSKKMKQTVLNQGALPQ